MNRGMRSGMIPTESVGVLITAWMVRAHLLTEEAICALGTAVTGDDGAQLLTDLRRAGWVERLAARRALYQVGRTGRTYAEGVGWPLEDPPPAIRWETLAQVNDLGVSIVIGAATVPWVYDVTWQASNGAGADGVARMCYDRHRRGLADSPGSPPRYDPFPGVPPAAASYVVELHLFVSPRDAARIDQAAHAFGRLLRRAAAEDPPVGRQAMWIVPTPRAAAMVWTRWMQTAGCPVWIGPPPPEGWVQRPGWAWTEACWRDEHGRARVIGPTTATEWTLRSADSPPPRANPWERTS